MDREMARSLMAAAGSAGAVGGGRYDNVATEVRELQVNRALNDLARNVDLLEGAAQQLVQRACAVLRPCGPEASNKAGNNTPHPVIAPMAEQLHSLAARIDAAAKILIDAHERMEV